MNKEENTKDETTQKLDDKDETIKDLEYKWKRALADYQNLQKETAKEKAEFVKFANGALLMEILPVYENLKLAADHIDAAKENEKILPKEIEGVAMGIRNILSQFEKILQENGVDIIDEVDIEFNPNEHHAVTQITINEKERVNKVAMIIKPGYKLHGKVIQAAKVVVYAHNAQHITHNA